MQLKDARDAHNALLGELEVAQARAEAVAGAGTVYVPEYAPEGCEGPPPPQMKGGAVADLAKALFGRPLWGVPAAAAGGVQRGGGPKAESAEAPRQQQQQSAVAVA